MLVAGLATLPSPTLATNFPTRPRSRTGLDGIPPTAASQVETAFKAVLTRMLNQGWGPILKRIAGFDLEAAAAGDEPALFAELPIERTGTLREFGGRRAVQPGDPAMSLIYHVLAASEACFEELILEAYPTIAEIDAVENYIYDRSTLTDVGKLVPAIFAYDYRQAFKTPHLAHADMVFTRAGVSRTGTQSCIYDRILREHGAPAGGGGTQDCATVPARFGLFLAERRDHKAVGRIAGESGDGDREFLLPVCKLVSGGRLLDGRGIQFQHSHRDEKLARLMEKHGEIEDGFDLNAPPFLRKSMSEDGPEGPRTFSEETSPLVSIKSLAGSVRVFPGPRPLAREAVQSGQIAHFPVPAKVGGSFSNRRSWSKTAEPKVSTRFSPTSSSEVADRPLGCAPRATCPPLYISVPKSREKASSSSSAARIPSCPRSKLAATTRLCLKTVCAMAA